MPGVIGVYQQYKVHWGGFSILKTEMFLLEQALKYSDFRYVHLLSGTDYPIRPLSQFLDKFDNANSDYIEATHLPNPNWHFNTMYRLQYFFLMDYKPVQKDDDIIRNWKLGENLAKYGLKRNIPDEFPHIYGGSQWFSLSRKCITILMEYTQKHPKFYNRMRFVFAPDEIYIPTVVMNLNYDKKEVVNDNLRIVNWKVSNAPHPALLNKSDIGKLVLGEKYFVRKVDESSSQVIELINKFLLSEELPSYEETGVRSQKTLHNFYFDEGLASCMSYLCKAEKIRKIFDLGCGPGYYVNYLRHKNIVAYGYDGNPYVKELSTVIMTETKFPCERLLVHEPIESYNKADLVIFLAVGEYIHKKYEDVVWDNICKLTTKYLIISWAEDKKYDNHIINPKSQDDLVTILHSRGFEIQSLGTQMLKDSTNNVQYKNSICFFCKS